MKIGDVIEIEGKGKFEIRDVGGPSLSDYVPVLHPVPDLSGLDKAWNEYFYDPTPKKIFCRDSSRESFYAGAHALLKYAEMNRIYYCDTNFSGVSIDILRKWCGK